MKKSIFLVVGALFLLPCVLSAQVQIEVLQGGVSKGTFTAYSGSASAAANFNYTYPGSNPTIGPLNVGGEEQLFFYQQTTTGELHFNTIFRNGGGGSTRYLNWDIQVLHAVGSPPSAVVVDDLVDGELFVSGSGSGTTSFAGRWVWIHSFTDGGVIGPLVGNWEVRINPVNVLNGPDAYDGGVGTEDLAVYGSGSTTPIGLAKNLQQIIFRPVAVPDPGSTVLLVGLGLAGLLAARRQRRA